MMNIQRCNFPTTDKTKTTTSKLEPVQYSKLIQFCNIEAFKRFKVNHTAKILRAHKSSCGSHEWLQIVCTFVMCIKFNKYCIPMS